MSIRLIAEVSSNHGGSIPLAKEFIRRFADAGADFVKFQTTRVKHLSPADPQYQWFQRAELSDDAHFELKEACEQSGVTFLTTIYNAAEVPLMLSLGVETVKLGAGEYNENSVRHAVEKAKLEAFVSVPLDAEYRLMLRSLALSTVTRYPASERACLQAIARIDGMAITGYSDHSHGLDMPRWAMECGATLIEKHVQLDNQARTPKVYEATVAEFKALRQYADDAPVKFTGRWQYA